MLVESWIGKITFASNWTNGTRAPSFAPDQPRCRLRPSRAARAIGVSAKPLELRGARLPFGKQLQGLREPDSNGSMESNVTCNSMGTPSGAWTGCPSDDDGEAGGITNKNEEGGPTP
jgi:hypothetical protein